MQYDYNNAVLLYSPHRHWFIMVMY